MSVDRAIISNHLQLDLAKFAHCIKGCEECVLSEERVLKNERDLERRAWYRTR